MATLAQRLSYLKRTTVIVWEASGGLLVGWLLLLAVQGAIPVGTVYLTKPLVDGLQAALSQGGTWESLQPLIRIGLGLGALLAIGELVRVALQWIGFSQGELVQDHVSDLVHAKATTVDMAFYETADLLDRLYRVRHDATNRPLALLEGAGSLVQNSVTVVGIGALLLAYGPWLALALLAGTIPAFIVVLRSSRQYHDWWSSSTSDRRRAHYFGDLLTGTASAAEVRLFALGEHFRTAYRNMRASLRSARLKLLRRQSLTRLGAESVAAATSVLTVGWMIWRALRGLATLGDIALFYQAFQRGQGLVRALFGNINQLYSNSLFLENLFEFLDLEPGVRSPAAPAPVPARIDRGLRFVDVTFRYPGTDRVALDRFELTVRAGQTVAIVGANGAGKSTLIKLLARFYDPQSGHVEIDGTDLRLLDPAALHRIMTVMFQSPMAYQGTVRENIAMSDLRTAADGTRVSAAAREAGALELIERLPLGYESILGKQFPGGTELSGGEWQRIAMARAYFRRSPLVVLDEPTSHLDSWAESEWFARFHELTKGATTIIVTHRLAIARNADVIYVMEQGRIVESGTHETLIALGGRYAGSWKAQTQPAPTGSA